MSKGQSCLAFSKIQLCPLGVLYQHIWNRRPIRYITTLGRTAYILVQLCSSVLIRGTHYASFMITLFRVTVLWYYENSSWVSLNSFPQWILENMKSQNTLCNANSRISIIVTLHMLTEKNIIHILKQLCENLSYLVMNAGWNFISLLINFPTCSGQISDYSIYFSKFKRQDFSLIWTAINIH